MNAIGVEAFEGVREAVESPTGPEADGSKAGVGRRGRRQQQRQRQQQRPRQQSGGRDAITAPSSVAGRSESKSRRRGGRADAAAAAAGDQRAVRGEVGEYIPPGGSVELGLFGKKLVSFGQVTLMPYILVLQTFVACTSTGEAGGWRRFVSSLGADSYAIFVLQSLRLCGWVGLLGATEAARFLSNHANDAMW